MRFIIYPIATIVMELQVLEGVIGFGNAHSSVGHVTARRAHNLLDLNGNIAVAIVAQSQLVVTR
jgi:hypothetical protein